MKRDKMAALLPSFSVYRAAREALKEDLGRAGDVTTNAIIPESARASVAIRAREPGRIAGIQFVDAAIRTLDPDAEIEIISTDGASVEAGDTLASISAGARAILTGERTALNFLGHLSGIATLTSNYVETINGTGAKICCTRKTTPGMREFEKYAVRAGGGINHRFGLDDAILIKDNHIAIAGSISSAIKCALENTGHMLKVEIEVDTIEQLEKALKYPIDAVLLDNMSNDELTQAVTMIKATAQKIIIEASGGVNLNTVKAIAGTGVDLISVGALTHSAPTLDLGLDFESLIS